MKLNPRVLLANLRYRFEKVFYAITMKVRKKTADKAQYEWVLYTKWHTAWRCDFGASLLGSVVQDFDVFLPRVRSYLDFISSVMQTSFDAPRRIPAEDGRSNSGEWSAKWTTKGSLHFFAIQWAYFMHSGEYTKAYTEENFSERFFFNHDDE